MCRKSLLVFLCVVFICSGSSLTAHAPCWKDDEACITRLSNEIYKQIMAGIPALQFDSLDPIHHDEIEGNFATLKYTLKNITIEGLKDCDIVKSKLSLEKHRSFLQFDCPYILMYGLYEIGGQILTIPIQGNGDLRVETTNYRIDVVADTKVTSKGDGTNYLTYKSYKVTSELLGQLNANSTDLFNGQKELADYALKFINTNGKAVSSLLQAPIFNANIKQMIKHFNKYLKTTPLDTLLTQ